MPGENLLLEPGFEFLAETGLFVPLQGCGDRLEGARDCRFKIDEADEEDSLRTDGHLGNLALFPEGEGDRGDGLTPRIEITLAAQPSDQATPDAAGGALGLAGAPHRESLFGMIGDILVLQGKSAGLVEAFLIAPGLVRIGAAIEPEDRNLPGLG